MIYQTLASILKDQDKLEEATLVINQALDKNLINKKWEIQKNLFFPKIPSNREEIKMYREKIKKEIEKILNISFRTKLDYDKE